MKYEVDGVKFSLVGIIKKEAKKNGGREIKVTPSSKYKNEFVVTWETEEKEK